MISGHERLPLRARHCLGVLVEVCRVIEPWQDEFYLIGGWAVYALTEVFLQGQARPPLRHRGSMDVDISFAWPTLTAGKAQAVAAGLRAGGYEGPNRFRWRRPHPQEKSPFDLDLMIPDPPGHEDEPLEVGGQELGPFWNGAVALRRPVPVLFQAVLPDGRPAEVVVRVASPTGLLFAKAQIPFVRHANVDLVGSAEQNNRKHLYDVFAIARTFPGGQKALAGELARDLDLEQLQHLADVLSISFGERGGMGPSAVVQEMGLSGEAAERQATEVQRTLARLLDGLSSDR